MVKKKDTTWRICIEYRKVNSQSIKKKSNSCDWGPFGWVKWAKKKSKLNLRSGYHQVRMYEPDIKRTAFRTYFGHFECLVMPFRLSNKPATFQALMNEDFGPYLRKSILVFFDDALIYSKDMKFHLQHLKIVLTLFMKHSSCKAQ